MRPVSLLHRARFVVSAARLDQLPAPTTAEVCFAGRSNSGKSSAINVLTNQKRLAFSSKTPGRTRLINLFGIPDPLTPDAWLGFLVDLPGYGYAAVDPKAREAWAEVLGGYLHERASLAGVVLVIDIRRGVTELDRRLAHWIGLRGLPTLALLAKADKLPYGQRIRAVAQTRQDLAEIGTLTALPFSATQRIGLDEAGELIMNWISPSAVP